VNNQPLPGTGWTTHAEVVRVLDGDTIEVEIKRKITVRIRDCWCHETTRRQGTSEENKQKGLAAKQCMGALLAGCGVDDAIAGSPVVCHFPTTAEQAFAEMMTFGRVVGDVYGVTSENEGVNLASEMIDAGHAAKTKEELLANGE
jgi:endonuclease YncB( thermonuclease family)